MTINDIIYWVRQRTGKTPDTGLPDGMILTFVNQVIREWADYFQDSFLTTSTATVNGSSINAPTGMIELKQLVVGGDDYRIVDENDLRFYDATNDKICYYRGGVIYLRPATTASTAYTVHYLASPTDMTTTAAIPQIPYEWHGKLATYVAALMSPAADLLMEKDAILKEVRRRPRKAMRHKLMRTWADDTDKTISD